MGNDEKRVYTYVLFEKREKLIQFPQTGPVVISFGPGDVAEFRPVFLFWDKTDEVLMRFYERWVSAGRLRKTFSEVIKRHIQNKYKEVFLSNPETLFLSESAKREIPPVFWQMSPEAQVDLCLGFGRVSARDVLRNSRKTVSLFWVLDEDCRYDRLLDWLVDAEKAAGPNFADLFLFGTSEQKESGEEILEHFYEETGLAGSFCLISECRKGAAQIKGDVLMVDCLGLASGQIGRPAYYIDGAGVRTEKEMKRLSGVCKACYSLRNHLDRAFLSAL